MSIQYLRALLKRPGHSVVAVVIAPTSAAGKFDTLCVGTEHSGDTLIAALALLADLADQVRQRMDVAGSAQMLARAERCREILTAELAQ